VNISAEFESTDARPKSALLDYTNLALFLLFLGLCAFIFTAQKSFHSVEQVDLHNRTSRQALENINMIGETMSLLKDIETGQRGYVITGDDAYLQPYIEARAQFNETYEKMVRGLDQSTGHKFSRKKLDELVGKRIARAEFVVNERRAKGNQFLREAAAHGQDRNLMDQIRQEIGVLEDEQRRLSGERIQNAKAVQASSLQLNFWLSVGGTILMIFSAVFLLRERGIRNFAEEKLKAANMSLEQMVQERTLQLQKALERIKSFALELDQSIERERRRLAREVHDQLGQVFTSLKLVVLGTKNQTPESLEKHVAEISQLLDEGIVASRRISSELRPALLDDFGLGAAVEHYAKTFTSRGGPKMTVEVAHDHALSGLQANQLFRILQEAATNALRHAKAENMEVEGKLINNVYHFSISDDGIGPQPIRKDASGVRNMRERAALVGGSFQFIPAKPKGTCIQITIPLQSE